MAHANARTNLFARRLIVERFAAGWPAGRAYRRASRVICARVAWVPGGACGQARGCRPGPRGCLAGVRVHGAGWCVADNREMDQRAELLRALEDARAETAGRVAEFEAAVASIVRSRGDDTDDEHDPDGTTLSWERALHAGTVDAARAHLAEIDAAITRLRDGWDGTCEACGNPIARERLAVRPSASRCITCASRGA